MINVISSDVESEGEASWIGLPGELEWKNDDVLRISSPEYEVEFSSNGDMISQIRFGEISNEGITKMEDITE